MLDRYKNTLILCSICILLLVITNDYRTLGSFLYLTMTGRTDEETETQRE